MEFPLKTVERVLKEAGAKRVSKDAAKEFEKFMEDYASALCKKAKELVELRGKKTIKEKDILTAKNHVKQP